MTGAFLRYGQDLEMSQNDTSRTHPERHVTFWLTCRKHLAWRGETHDTVARRLRRDTQTREGRVMRKVVRVTVHYIGASWRERREWTELVAIPANASPDKLATRCERNMQRHGYDTRGVTYQVLQSTDLVAALVESAQ